MIQLAIIVAYLVLLLALGVAANRWFRGTSEDYMLASHSIGPFFLLMSLFGTTMTAFALVGSTGEAFKVGAGVYGMLASASGIVHSLCFFVIGLKLWGFGRRYGYTTQIQFFRDRLESDKIGVLLFPVLVSLVIPYLLIGVLAAGAVINGVTHGAFPPGWFEGSGRGVPYWLASLVVCGVVLMYVFYGGMRGTAWANAFQTLVFMFLGVITFATIASGIGGADSFLENLRIASAGASEEKLSRGHLPKSIYFSFLFIPLSVAMFPHVFQHWLTARDAKAFKLPIVAHPIFIMIVWLPCVLIGVWATGAGLDADIDPNRVLGTLVHEHAGEVLGGLLTAGILAAIMSSLDSQFLCLGTMFTGDIVLHYGGRKRFSDRQVVIIARSFIVAIVAITYLFSLAEPRGVFAMGIWCFSGFTGLFPLVFAAIYWRRLTAAGAAASVVAVLVSWATMFYKSGFGMNKFSFPSRIPEGADAANVSPLMKAITSVVPPLMPVVSIFVLSAVVMIVVSLLTRPPSEKTLAKFFD